MNRAQSIRATLLGFAEFVVITVATFGIPGASGSLHERTVRLLRGMNQRAVFDSGSADELAIGQSAVSAFDPVPDEPSFSGDASDVAWLSSPLRAFAFDVPTILAFPIALDAPRVATGAPLRARAPPIG